MTSTIPKAVQQVQKIYPWASQPLIVQAPMRLLSGPALAVATSSAGGIGFIGPGAKAHDLRSTLEEASSLVAGSEHLRNHASQRLPIGIGIQTWAGDLKVAAEILREHHPAAAWLFAPRHGQAELDEWTRALREASPGIQIWIQIASVADARAAATSQQRPDVLVVQGHDAGGHSLTQGAGIITLFPEVLDALSEANVDLPVFAAGGIADARGAAAALTLGATGVALGTRFLASTEAKINPGYQRHVIDAVDGGQNTVRTQLYNHLRGTTDWPAPFDARGIINQSWRDHKSGISFEENKRLHEGAVQQGEKGWGDQGRIATYAGTNVGLIRTVKPAAHIVREIQSGIAKVLRQTAYLVDSEQQNK